MRSLARSASLIGLLGLLGLLTAGCLPDKSNDDGDAGEGDTGEETTTGAETDTTTGTETDTTTGTETDTTTGTETDTTTGTETDTTTGAGEQHPLCEMPAPIPLPALPEINVDALGDPLFAGWQDLACEGLGVQTCTTHEQCNNGSGRCLFGEVGGTGVCTSPDIDVWCDGEGEGLNFLGFDCFACSPIQVHAQACCDALPGFDCRTWPYPSDGPPNSVCARHEDCEPGLICGPHVGSGFGVCQCPGLGNVDLPNSCWQ